MLKKVYFHFASSEILLFVVIEILFPLKHLFCEAAVEEFKVVFNTMVVTVVGHRNEHHVRHGPAEGTG